MYQRIINAHVNGLIHGIQHSKAIQPYLKIMRLANDPEVDVSQHRGFRGVYCWFFKLRGLGQGFKDAYFGLMQEMRAGAVGGIEEILEHLYDVPVNSRITKGALQLSFASKLLHVLDNSLPIYDRKVGKFYGLPAIGYKLPRAQRVQKAVDSYNYLVEEYAKVLDGNLLVPAINAFRQHFDLLDENQFSDVKIIDTLIWQS